MTRASRDRFVCAFCPSRRVTKQGMESHLLHRHPAEYERATEDYTFEVMRVLP